MRVVFILPILLLTGCAGALERAISGQTAVSKLRTDLGADINLRAALQKDIAKKHAELQYVSAIGYGCGPDNAEFKELTQLNFDKPTPKETSDRIGLRVKFLTRTYGDLASILEYGDKLDQIIKEESDTNTALKDFQSLADGAASIIPAEFQPPLKALKGISVIYGAIYKYEIRVRLIKLANDNQKKLEDARDRIIKQRIHKQMTELERRAFYNWDTCAIDRLVFLRAYRPGWSTNLSGNLEQIRAKTTGEIPSPTLDFVALHEKYLEEKEAFIGQLVDYKVDIDAIVEANKKIANLPNDASPDDFIKALNEAAVDANTIKTNYAAIRDAVSTGK